MNKCLVAGALALAVAQPVLAQSEPPSEKFGSFALRTIVDPMNDATRGILASREGDVRMVIKCDNNGPGSLYVSFVSTRYLGALRYNTRAVKYRLDNAPAEAISAYYEGSTATISELKPSSPGGQWFARVLAASKLTVQVTNYNSSSEYTAVIDLSEFRAGAARAAAICKDANWYSIAQ